MKRSLHIGLVWHTFGHDNLGVDALSRANASILEAAARRAGLELRLTTLGSGQKPVIPDLPANVTIGPRISLKQIAQGRSEFLKVLKTCDLTIDIGEGDSFTDLYGRTRFLFHSATKLSSIFFRKPLVLAPQTIGPFVHPVHRWVAKQMLNRARAVFARDELSSAFLRDLGVSSPTDEFIDVAFRLPFTPAIRTDSVTKVGINVSGLLFNGGYTGKNELGMALDYASYTRQLITALIAKPNTEIYLFAHVASASAAGPDDDGPAIQTLAKEFPAVHIAPSFATSIEAKSWMSGLDFVVAGRMHACIGSYSAGVPVVPIAYSRKFNGLFGTLKYPYFVDGKATSTERALADTLKWFEDRDQLKSEIKASQSIISERLQRYEDFLVELLSAIAKKG